MTFEPILLTLQPTVTLKINNIMQYGEVRIIGGQWRSRKLKFPALPGLRPTPNSVRETAFNWLQPYIHGANCLDLFAGSGALGFEALSRGAAYTFFVDKEPRIVRYLQEQLGIFKTENGVAYCLKFPCKSLPLEKLPVKHFDIIFLDPPFQRGWIKLCLEWLEQQPWLTTDTLVYLEAEAQLTPLPISLHWQILNSKITGQVGHHLIQYTP